MEVVLIDNLLNEDEARKKLKEFIFTNFFKEKKNASYIQIKKSKINKEGTTVCVQWIVSLLRKFKLLPKQAVILPVYNQQQLLMLCLAEINKKNTGNFETTASDVLDIWKMLFKEALSDDKNGSYTSITQLEELKEAKKYYEDFLEACLYFDYFSLLKLVKNDLRSENSKLSKELQNMIVVVEDVEEFSTLELMLFKSVLKNVNLYKAFYHKETESMNFNISGIGEDLVTETDKSEACPITIEKIEDSIDSIFLCNNFYGLMTSPSPCSSSSSELYIEQLFLYHLRLLLNTRDELAIVSLLNMPGRDLDQNSFNEIKKVAKEKDRPIYQLIMSNVLKSQLGGKYYSPDSECPIVQNKKVLSEFLDSVMKLQAIVEEYTDTKEATHKIIYVIKSNIKRLCIRKVSGITVENVYNHFTSILDQILTHSESIENEIDSPESKKCFGRATLRVSNKLKPSLMYLRGICDYFAGKNTAFVHANLIGECVLSQADGNSLSPFRVVSILSLFKSPCVPTGAPFQSTEQSTPLRQRIMKQNGIKGSSEKKIPIPKNVSCLAWASNTVSPMNTELSSPGIVVGPTLKAIGSSNISKSWKEIVEEIPKEVFAQEEIDNPSAASEILRKKGSKRSLLKDISNLNTEKAKKKKKEDKEPKTKKKIDKGPLTNGQNSKSKKGNIKQIPKGQRCITSFFTK